MRGRLRFLFLIAAVATGGVAPAQGAPCLVVGDNSARVSTSEGERSPVFLAVSCESVRQISGRAQASWVGSDGKPRVVPITAAGPDAIPEPGVADQPASVIWYELTTRREAQRPAFRRDLIDAIEPRIYIPPEGLFLSDSASVPTILRISEVAAGGEARYEDLRVEVGQPVRLPAEKLLADKVYHVESRHGEITEQWQWRTLPQGDANTIRQCIEEIKMAVADPLQQGLVVAMLYEQRRLGINRRLLMQQLNR